MYLIFITVTIAAFAVLIGLLGLLRNPRSSIHSWLALFILASSLWITIGNIQTLLPSDLILLSLKITFIASAFVGFCMLYFVKAVIGGNRRTKWIYIDYFLLGIIVALSLSTLVIQDISSFNISALRPLRGPAYPLVLVIILQFIVRALYVAEKARRKSRARKRDQLNTIFGGLLGGTILAVVTNVILPNLTGDTFTSRFAFLAVSVWTAMLTYAVIQHRFLDIRLTVVRALAYLLALGAVSLLYSVLIVVISQFFLGGAGASFPSYDIFLVIFVALTFHPLRVFFDRITRRLFYRNAYDTQEVLDRINDVFTRTVNLHTITKQTLEIVDTVLRPQFSILFITSPGGSLEHIQTMNKTKKDAKELFKLTESKLPQLALIDEISRESPRLAKRMTQLNVSIIVRVEISNQQLGYLFFGFKENGSIYTSQDINLIRLITDGLSVSVQNALRFDEIQAFNATLQRRINEATEELRRSNTQLQRLDQAKDEFVSMASHQLRTPLTSVKGYISMVLEGDAGKLSAMQKQLLGEAYTSSERMVHLINDFLNVSRLQTGKFTIERRGVDLAKVVKKEVESLATTAQAHNLTLDYHAPSYFPILYVDEAKLGQVVMNFIDNAIYYSPEQATITVRLETIAGEAVLTVQDKGIGVPKDEQAHLFTKFFRATNARRQRPDGTGVGLFLAKKVVVAHGGTMVVESEEGKGSTFGFRLPIKKLSAAPAKNLHKLDK